MARPTTAEEALEQAALGPKSMTVDGTSITGRDLDELREQANREAADGAASTNRFFGLRRIQLISPGANR